MRQYECVEGLTQIKIENLTVVSPVPQNKDHSFTTVVKFSSHLISVFMCNLIYLTYFAVSLVSLFTFCTITIDLW